jgi:hypothetical protein
VGGLDWSGFTVCVVGSGYGVVGAEGFFQPTKVLIVAPVPFATALACVALGHGDSAAHTGTAHQRQNNTKELSG